MEKINNSKTIYKKMIDNLVEESNSLSSSLIVEKKIYSKAIGHEEYNNFISSLSEEQRILLANMIRLERESAFHDVLATLTWWIDCEDVTLCHKGNVMPVQLSGMGLHGDYIGRLQDWEWPE